MYIPFFNLNIIKLIITACFFNKMLLWHYYWSLLSKHTNYIL